MEFLRNLVKGIFVGLGGVAPGISGSVIMVILGLYEKTIKAIGSFFKDVKKNIKFLLPLGIGLVIGLVLFSKIIVYLLENYEFQTRYAFFGLIVGTVPVFYKEVKKKRFKTKHYAYVLASTAIGFGLFIVNARLFPTIINPNWIQSILLGVVVAASSIIPGIDSAAILTSLGMYDLWTQSIANLNWQVLMPALLGLAAGGVLISMGISFLLKKRPRTTFAVILGLFLSTIPRVIMEPVCLKLSVPNTVLAADFFVLGLAVSLYLGNYKTINHKIRKKIKEYQKRHDT